MRKEAQGVSSKKMTGHIYFMEDNLLHTMFSYVLMMISVAPCCYLSSSYTLNSIVHTASIEIRPFVK